MRWLGSLMAHIDLPKLSQLFPLFDGIFHLSADDQNIIINDGSPLLGQEIQTFIGTLISGHNRQAQMWLNFNAAASEEHQAEVEAQSARNTRQQSLLVIIRSDEQTSEVPPSTRPRQTTQRDTTSYQSPSAQNFPEKSQTPGARQPDL